MIYHGDALTYVTETPDILSYIYRNRQSICKDALTLLNKDSVGEILIIGTGSSYNAGYAVRNYLQHMVKKRVSVIYPSELKEMLCVCDNDAVIIGISQQGTSVSVIEAVDFARDSGKKTVVMTGEPDTELEKHGDVLIPIECGEEDAGATTKGFTATAYTLLMLCMELAGKELSAEEQILKEKLYLIPQEAKRVLEAQKEQINAVVDQLSSFEQLTIISDPNYKDILPEIVLKFSETCRKPVSGMETEAFCHGMYNAVGDQTTFLFLHNGEDRRVQKLINYYLSFQNTVIEVEASSFDTDLTFPFSMLLFIQYVMINVSRKKGINLNIPRDPEFHKIMGSKLEDVQDCTR